jgi:uncharacterized protein YlxW (UPF0749 family)
MRKRKKEEEEAHGFANANFIWSNAAWTCSEKGQDLLTTCIGAVNLFWDKVKHSSEKGRTKRQRKKFLWTNSLKQKLERLKNERKSIENAYTNSKEIEKDDFTILNNNWKKSQRCNY